MIEIIGVHFVTTPAKSFFYRPVAGEKFKIGDKVVAQTSRGVELGEVTIANRNHEPSPKQEDIPFIIRRANNKDFQAYHTNRADEKQAAEIAMEKVRLHQLDMTVISAHYMLDRGKILIYFEAENRVDFRDLVKTLAASLRAHIELRQIGVRDKARLLGGLGTCGRPFCCSSFLSEFTSVSVQHAKEQGLSLNPQKISGCCGRLLCCLKYEEEAYKNELNPLMPGIGAIVTPKEGPLKGKEGRVEHMFLVRSLLKVRFEAVGEAHILPARDVDVIKRGANKPGEGTKEENNSSDTTP